MSLQTTQSSSEKDTPPHKIEISTIEQVKDWGRHPKNGGMSLKEFQAKIGEYCQIKTLPKTIQLSTIEQVKDWGRHPKNGGMSLEEFQAKIGEYCQIKTLPKTIQL